MKMKTSMKMKLATVIVTVILALLFITACGGGGGSESPATNSYIGFEASDFSGKTVYLVGPNYWLKGVFNPNSVMQAYEPNQTGWYQEGTWVVVAGKLILSTVLHPEDKAIYTLLSDDTVNRYMRISQQRSDGTVYIIGMFYDQSTAAFQASEFVVNHRVP